MAVAGIASKRNLEALGKPSPDLVARPQSLLSMASIEVEEVRFRPQHQAAASRPAGEVMVLVQSNRRRRRSSPFKAPRLEEAAGLRLPLASSPAHRRGRRHGQWLASRC